MTAFEDGLWTRLVDDHEADRVALRFTPPGSGKRPLAIGGGLAAIAAAATVGVVTLTAATTAPPAYALTQNPDGSITVSLNDLTTGIPALNARLKALGINDTVVPVEAGCTTPGLIAGPGDLSETVTLSSKYNTPGLTGVLAAEQLPDGQIAIGIGSTDRTVPSCFSPKAFTVQPSSTPLPGTSTSTDSSTSSTRTTTPTIGN